MFGRGRRDDIGSLDYHETKLRGRLYYQEQRDNFYDPLRVYNLAIEAEEKSGRGVEADPLEELIE